MVHLDTLKGATRVSRVGDDLRAYVRNSYLVYAEPMSRMMPPLSVVGSCDKRLIVDLGLCLGTVLLSAILCNTKFIHKSPLFLSIDY